MNSPYILPADLLMFTKQHPEAVESLPPQLQTVVKFMLATTEGTPAASAHTDAAHDKKTSDSRCKTKTKVSA